MEQRHYVSSGLVSVIGGPLPTGRRHAIEQVIRTSAPMHEGFAGGALLGADGRLLGVTDRSVDPRPRRRHSGRNCMEYSGRPAAAWDPQTRVSRDRRPARARLRQAEGCCRRRPGAARRRCEAGTPADEAGVFVGDLLLSLDGHALSSPDELSICW
jgi:S1-C subfamily serine protease